MINKFTAKRTLYPAVLVAISAAALSGCKVDDYSSDVSNVRCDGERTKAELQGDGVASFIVRGTDKAVATIKVRRQDDMASVAMQGDVPIQPGKQDNEGFAPPTKIVDGSELSAFGANGAWLIDVRDDSVVISGSCN